MSKKFSIVCLTYKRIDMLEEAIYSVLQQTYKDIELLVINDCNLHKLSYSHPDINIINLDTKFKTLGEKRNFGLKNVNGEYVMYLDDDDLLLPNYIENINNKIGNNDWLSAQKVILYNENSLDIKPSHWLIPNPIFRKSISENVYYDDINYDELTPFYKKIISKGSGLFSLLKDENVGYVYRQNIPSSYSMFNLRYKSIDEQNELLNSIEYKTGDIELNPHWNKDYVDIIKTNIKYQPKPSMKTILNNTGSNNTIIMANNWTKVKKSWEKAESFLNSMTSRGIISTAMDVLNIDKSAGEKVSDEIYNLRRDSCFGNDSRSIKQCDQLKYNDSLESFCGSCGCGQTKLAKLDGDGYTKLHYPYLECPLKKEGFSNHEVPLSVIIPVLNDNEELNLTIESLYNTSPSSIDVIVIDDASTVPVVVNDKRVRFYRFEERRGAGQARHFGAEQAKSKHLLFIDSHMRFDENWYENAMKRIINTPKTLWCGVCLGLGEGNMDIKKANGCYTGADLVLYAEKNKTIFDGVWKSDIPDSDDYEISCVMGACYFIHKDWFFHIKGLGQTMMWGSEEPILSVKSWFAGGEVRIMKSVKLGHKFRNQSPYVTNFSHINYNKLAYMYMLFPTELYEFLKGKFNNDGNLIGAMELVERNKAILDEEKEYYKSIFVRDIKWLCNKFNITIDLETEKKNYSITAIMPTCGRTKCIGESIYSFINQTYQNKKLIILDTHPQDIKFNINLPDNIIYMKEDSHKFNNLGDKFKQLINLVDTDFFCIWEDDDLWLPDHLENLVNLYDSVDKNETKFPLKLANKNHFSMLGGVDKPIYKIIIDSNVCWCRYLFQNKKINMENVHEPFDVSFSQLFTPVWLKDDTIPNYIYRWDNDQCHMSGLYGQKSFNELYRMFEDELMKTDISNTEVVVGWRHDYSTICKYEFGKLKY